MVGGVGGVEQRVAAGVPREAGAVDDDPAEAGAVAAEPLGERVDDDVGAVGERAGEGGGGEGGVDDQRQAVGAGDVGDGLEVGDLERGVGHRLAEQGAGVGVDRGGEAGWVGGVDEADADAERGQDVVELGVGAAVEVAGGDDVVAGAGEVDDGVEDRGGAGGVGQAGGLGGALQQADALLEHLGGGVHQAGVDVAQLAQREQAGRVRGAAELIGGGAVDGHRAREGGRVRGGAAVEAEGFEVHGGVWGSLGLGERCGLGTAEGDRGIRGR